MSGKFDLAPGIEIEWASPEDGSEPMDEEDIQGKLDYFGGPGWRPHFSGDIMRVLADSGQTVIVDGDEVPEKNIPEYGYPLFKITYNTFNELEEEFSKRL